MAKPPAIDWSTDTNYAVGPAIGTPTKIAPSAGNIQSGFVPGTSAIPQHVNFLIDALADWTDYLDNLPFETQFLNNVFNFGTHVNVAGNLDVNGAGPHTFTGAVSATGALSGTDLNATGNVDIDGTLNVDGVSQLNATVHVNGGSSHLEVHGGDLHIWSGDLFIDSGGAVIADGLDVGGSTGITSTGGVRTLNTTDFKYLGSGTKSVTRSLTSKNLKPASHASTVSNVGYVNPSYSTWSTGAATNCGYSIKIPAGSTLTEVRVRGMKAAAGGPNPLHSLFLVNLDAMSLSPSATLALDVLGTSTAGANYDTQIFSGSQTIGANHDLILTFYGSAAMNLTTETQVLYSVRVTYTTNKPVEDIVVP